MATIKPIEGRSVHQIQSGQVIVDLQSVCKELVENSIDAGATSIEVRFKNNGLDSVEVQDNGGGIAPDDYATIALKHYTSKLATYDDLTSLQTFGFRGEALSSLCALSNFHIVTARPADGPRGTKLEFEQSGKLKGTSVVAAKQGTTVAVGTLFHNLPVRRKELEKNIKREYNKVLQLLNAYACVSVGVKLSVSNTMPKGKKTVAFTTNANASTRDNISNVYGAKTITALIPLDLDFDMSAPDRPAAAQTTRKRSMQEDIASHKVKIIGHISKPVVGEGRQTPDRQMFFVNTRPCNLPQVAKAINEVYKSYNITQSPFVFADIKLDTNAYDVNVSPDKRTIMLHDQTVLLESLKKALLELFQGHEQSVPQAQVAANKSIKSAFKTPTLAPRASSHVRSDDDEVKRDHVPFHSRPAREASQLRQDQSLQDAARPGFVKASLLERFAGRDAEERIVRPPARRRRSSSSAGENVVEECILHPRTQDRANEGQSEPRLERESTSPVCEHSPLFVSAAQASLVPIRSSGPAKAVEDFNALMGLQLPPQAHNASAAAAEDGDGVNQQEADEETIPAIEQTSQRQLPQSSIQNAFDRMRPMRTPAREATITVGDVTTVTTIGSGTQSRAAKRARIHIPKFSLSGKPLDQIPISKSLRAFAAPGTQLRSSYGEDEDEDTNLPLAWSPSLLEPVPSHAFLEPCTDDPVERSSPPTLPAHPRTDTTSAIGAQENGTRDFGDSIAEHVDKGEKKAREEAKIAKLIADAERAAARPTEANLKRAGKLFKVSQNKYRTINMERVLETDADAISTHLHALQRQLDASENLSVSGALPSATQLGKEDPEERLSLTVTKQDFDNMRVIGQFNLGFIIAVRPPTATSPTPDLFIIDQHASDEKYNFERLSATTQLVSQRLVHPHPLELTAVEEELVLANAHALTANGFVVETDADSTKLSTGQRTKLTSLPMSKEVTFTPTDLEELLALIFDNPPSSSMSTSTHIPRPSKVRKLLASRACRSSVMIGKTLTSIRMREIVKHMGSMDKPWSCPHGRPTMRHLYGLESWTGWREGDGVQGVGDEPESADWETWLDKEKMR